MRFSETCRCGGAFTVDDAELNDATAALDTWRVGHRCGPSRERDHGSTGASTSFGFLPNHDRLMDVR